MTIGPNGVGVTVETTGKDAGAVANLEKVSNAAKKVKRDGEGAGVPLGNLGKGAAALRAALARLAIPVAVAVGFTALVKKFEEGRAEAVRIREEFDKIFNESVKGLASGRTRFLTDEQRAEREIRENGAKDLQALTDELEKERARQAARSIAQRVYDWARGIQKIEDLEKETNGKRKALTIRIEQEVAAAREKIQKDQIRKFELQLDEMRREFAEQARTSRDAVLDFAEIDYRVPLQVLVMSQNRGGPGL